MTQHSCFVMPWAHRVYLLECNCYLIYRCDFSSCSCNTSQRNYSMRLLLFCLSFLISNDAAWAGGETTFSFKAFISVVCFSANCPELARNTCSLLFSQALRRAESELNLLNKLNRPCRLRFRHKCLLLQVAEIVGRARDCSKRPVRMIRLKWLIAHVWNSHVVCFKANAMHSKSVSIDRTFLLCLAAVLD